MTAGAPLVDPPLPEPAFVFAPPLLLPALPLPALPAAAGAPALAGAGLSPASWGLLHPSIVTTKIALIVRIAGTYDVEADAAFAR